MDINNNKTDEYIIQKGFGTCWLCGRIINSKITFKENIYYRVNECPIHGTYSQPLGKEPPYSKQKKEIPDYYPKIIPKLGSIWDEDIILNYKSIPVLVFSATTKCNSSCRICFFGEQYNNATPEENLTTDILKNKLSKHRNKEVILCGGEPTLRKDLVELIQTIKKTGNIPVIQTNGLLLADIDYVSKLKNAGLEHIHLSFDGFNRAVYEKVRADSSQYDLKIKALRNIIAKDMKISLATVTIKGVNEDQVIKMIEYATENRNIVELAFIVLLLTEPSLKNGFGADSILFASEIKELIATSIDLPKEIFLLWDNLKLGAGHFLKNVTRFLPFLTMPIFGNDKIYLKREGMHLISLLNNRNIENGLRSLDKNSMRLFYDTLNLELTKIMIRKIFLGNLPEYSFLYRENILKITVVDYKGGFFNPLDQITSFGFYDEKIKENNLVHQRR